MTDYLDAVQFHKNGQTGKWRVSRIGYAKQNKKGDGWDVYLDALPMPGPDGCRISIQPRQERQQQQDAPPRQSAPASDLDDEIPF